MRKCKICKAPYEPKRPLDPACSFDCSVSYAMQVASKTAAKREQTERAKHRVRKEAAKTRAELLRACQVAFNALIRERDSDQPCISCQRYHVGQYHAGHYRSVGACPALRFERDNVHKQCAPCNTHLSGNAIEYRRNLAKKIGTDRLEWLEQEHEPKHYSRDEIIGMTKDFKRQLREAKNGD